jgi:hypothetical protein
MGFAREAITNEEKIREKFLAAHVALELALAKTKQLSPPHNNKQMEQSAANNNNSHQQQQQQQQSMDQDNEDYMLFGVEGSRTVCIIPCRCPAIEFQIYIDRIKSYAKCKPSKRVIFMDGNKDEYRDAQGRMREGERLMASADVTNCSPRELKGFVFRHMFQSTNAPTFDAFVERIVAASARQDGALAPDDLKLYELVMERVPGRIGYLGQLRVLKHERMLSYAKYRCKRFTVATVVAFAPADDASSEMFHADQMMYAMRPVGK